MNPSNTNPSQRSVQCLPLGANLWFAAFNCNGALTPVEEGKKKHKHIQLILRYFKSTGVQIFALQEPHLPTPAQPCTDAQGPQAHQVRETAKREGYSMLSQLTTDGLRGGVALLWNNQWEATWSCSLSIRILLANLRNVDGLQVTVLSEHFHHKEGVRSMQMQLLADTLPTLPLHHHVLVLADHNSVGPGNRLGNSISQGHPPPCGKSTRRGGGDTELLGGPGCLALCLVTGDPNEHHVTKGYARGAHTVLPDRVVHDQGDTEDKPAPSPHRRRIDRIHISTSRVPTLSRCFTHGMAYSDHRAVIVEPPPPPSGHCPT